MNRMKKERDTKQSTFNKAMILSIIKEKGSKTISELSKELNITRPAVYGHLDTLERHGLISRDKDYSKKGAPVRIDVTNKANPMTMKRIMEIRRSHYEIMESIK